MIQNSLLQRAFLPVNNDVLQNPNSRYLPNYAFKKGGLITFNYSYWKSDPYPLVIISPPPKQPQITVGVGKLWGVNLHKFSMIEVSKIINDSRFPSFSYTTSIKNTNLKDAYRCYKWSGIRQVKILNPEFLLNIISSIKSYDPAEHAIIRKNVQEQLKQQMNPKSYEIDKNLLNNKEPTTVPVVKTVPIVGSNNPKE